MSTTATDLSAVTPIRLASWVEYCTLLIQSLHPESSTLFWAAMSHTYKCLDRLAAKVVLEKSMLETRREDI